MKGHPISMTRCALRVKQPFVIVSTMHVDIKATGQTQMQTRCRRSRLLNGLSGTCQNRTTFLAVF